MLLHEVLIDYKKIRTLLVVILQNIIYNKNFKSILRHGFLLVLLSALRLSKNTFIIFMKKQKIDLAVSIDFITFDSIVIRLIERYKISFPSYKSFDRSELVSLWKTSDNRDCTNKILCGRMQREKRDKLSSTFDLEPKFHLQMKTLFIAHFLKYGHIRGCLLTEYCIKHDLGLHLKPA